VAALLDVVVMIGALKVPSPFPGRTTKPDIGTRHSGSANDVGEREDKVFMARAGDVCDL
jgi:hypothetical protein